MEEINKLISGLEEKVKTLIIKQNSILKKNTELETENQTLQSQINEHKKQITTLEEQTNLTKNQTKEITDTTNVMKSKITDIVKEIDTCIAQLS